MKTKKVAAPAYDRAAIEKILKAAQAKKHFMQGGDGCCCYIWINGGIFSDENCINLSGLDAALYAVPGVHSVKINLD